MKKLFLVTLGAVGVLVGCYSGISTNNKSYPALELHIVRSFEQKTGSTDYVTVRIPTSQMKAMRASHFDDTKGMVYLTSGSRFYIKNPIDHLKLEYTIINMPDKPNGVWRSFDEAKMKAQSLPPSAWRSYTVYPRQLLEQGRAMPAKGKPASHWHKTIVTVTLYVDANGNVTREIEHKPVSVGSGV